VKKYLRGLSVGDARATSYLEEARVLGDLVPVLADVRAGSADPSPVRSPSYAASSLAREGKASRLGRR
jgi:hypothetical protein